MTKSASIRRPAVPSRTEFFPLYDFCGLRTNRQAAEIEELFDFPKSKGSHLRTVCALEAL